MVGDPPLKHLMHEGIAVDRDGRVTFGDSELSERLRAALPAKEKPREPPPNGNCNGCNTTKDCGGPPDLICMPTNLVPECGSKVIR